MEDITTEKTGLLAKKQDDLTVGDSLKIVAVATAISVMVPVVIIAAASAFDSFAEWRKARKTQKKSDIENNIIEAQVVES